MADPTLWFTLGTAGMILGTLLLAYGIRYIPKSKRRRYAILIAVPGIAVVAYALMALNVGWIDSSTGGIVFIPRYIDWLLTTPLHIIYLGLFAGASMSVISRAAAFQAATILLGFAGALVSTPLKWVLYLAGSAAFAVVVYYAITDYGPAAERKGGTTAVMFRKLGAFLVVLWLIYPVIWLVGPNATGLMDVETTAFVVSYIDIVSKVGFGLIALNGQLLFSDVETGTAVPGD